jgi:hypothetical protein
MKKIIFCLLACFFATNSFAQITKGFVVGIDHRSCFKPSFKTSREFMSLDYVSTFGYKFNKYLSVNIPIGAETALFERDGIKTWINNGTLGLGLGFAFTSEDGAESLEIKASAGSTLNGDDNWKYAYYDAGFNVVIGKDIQAILGFGVRYYDARRDKNRTTMYGSLGLRVNLNSILKDIFSK